jgi:hypothetical protein
MGTDGKPPNAFKWHRAEPHRRRAEMADKKPSFIVWPVQAGA